MSLLQSPGSLQAAGRLIRPALIASRKGRHCPSATDSTAVGQPLGVLPRGSGSAAARPFTYPVIKHERRGSRPFWAVGAGGGSMGSIADCFPDLDPESAAEQIQTALTAIGSSITPPPAGGDAEEGADGMDVAADTATASTEAPEVPAGEEGLDAAVELLPSTDDMYGGIIIDPGALPSDPKVFRNCLQPSLKRWKEMGVKGVWLKLDLEQSPLVPEAVGEGFKYHHAEPNYVMLNQWLPDTPSTLPPNASHQVGVGAFVMNEKHEVLVVQERSGPLQGKSVWKMPTGLVSQGENLHEAAPREVFEETGIEAEFHSVLMVRQSHGMAFGKSDLFFVCALSTKPGRRQADPKACETEIAATQWMPLQEFLSIEFMRDRPLYAKILSTCEAWADGEYDGLKAEQLEAGIGRPRLDLLLHPGNLHSTPDDSCD